MVNPVIDRLMRSEHTSKLGKQMLPAFKRESMDERVDYIIKHNPIVAQYVQHNPAYRDDLLKLANDRYARSWQYFVGSKLVDNTKFLTSSAGLISDLAGPASGGTGNALSGLEDILELGIVMPYAMGYAIGMNDYKALPKFAAYEAASFIPIVGDMIDMKPIYSNRVRERFDTLVADDFLGLVSRGKSRTEH